MLWILKDTKKIWLANIAASCINSIYLIIRIIAYIFSQLTAAKHSIKSLLLITMNFSKFFWNNSGPVRNFQRQAHLKKKKHTTKLSCAINLLSLLVLKFIFPRQISLPGTDKSYGMIILLVSGPGRQSRKGGRMVSVCCMHACPCFVLA